MVNKSPRQKILLQLNYFCVFSVKKLIIWKNQKRKFPLKVSSLAEASEMNGAVLLTLLLWAKFSKVVECQGKK